MNYAMSVLFLLTIHTSPAPKSKLTAPLTNSERAIVFVVESEVRANHLEPRNDLCLGFGYGLKIDSKAIFVELRQSGIKIRRSNWCNDRLSGVALAIRFPIKELTGDTYEIEIQTGELRPDRDIAILLRRTTYTVKAPTGIVPTLTAYQKTCCPETRPAAQPSIEKMSAPQQASNSHPLCEDSPSHAKSQTISTKERQALIDLYNSTNGTGWRNHEGWLGPPGTECDWYGVACWDDNNRPSTVNGLELSENNLSGTLPESLGALAGLETLEVLENDLHGPIPKSLSELTHLDRLNIVFTHLSGLLPDPLIQRWLSGTLWINADAPQLSNISEIDSQSSASSVLCSSDRIILRSGGSATRLTERCRNVTPEDRSTYCEVKKGKVNGAEFAVLAWIIEKNGFFSLKPEYSRTVTDSGGESTRVTREGKAHTVMTYAANGPLELVTIQLAISGVESGIQWDQTTEQSKCPRWEDDQPPPKD
jgi:hypothetical protein